MNRSLSSFTLLGLLFSTYATAHGATLECNTRTKHPDTGEVLNGYLQVNQFLNRAKYKIGPDEQEVSTNNVKFFQDYKSERGWNNSAISMAEELKIDLSEVNEVRGAFTTVTNPGVFVIALYDESGNELGKGGSWDINRNDLPFRCE